MEFKVGNDMSGIGTANAGRTDDIPSNWIWRLVIHPFLETETKMDKGLAAKLKLPQHLQQQYRLEHSFIEPKLMFVGAAATLLQNQKRATKSKDQTEGSISRLVFRWFVQFASRIGLHF